MIIPGTLSGSAEQYVRHMAELPGGAKTLFLYSMGEVAQVGQFLRVGIISGHCRTLEAQLKYFNGTRYHPVAEAEVRDYRRLVDQWRMAVDTCHEQGFVAPGVLQRAQDSERDLITFLAQRYARAIIAMIKGLAEIHETFPAQEEHSRSALIAGAYFLTES